MTTDQIAGQYIYPSFNDELRGLLPGKVVVPGDTAWDAARTPWVANVEIGRASCRERVFAVV